MCCYMCQYMMFGKYFYIHCHMYTNQFPMPS